MQRDNLGFVEGRNTVLESLRNDRNIKIIYIDNKTKKETDKIKDLLQEAKTRKIPVLFKDRRFLDKISPSKDHQGIIAKAENIPTLSIESFCKKNNDLENVCVVVLKGITHEYNLGAIVRSLSAFGVSGLVIPHIKDHSSLSIVEKTAMGAFKDVSIVEASFYSALSLFKRNGYKLIAFENTAENTLFSEDFSGKVVLVFGGESDTLKEDVLDICDSFVKIPMHSKISSLNLSVAVSIVAFERLKKINYDII
ncbi:RNA methyltransferase [Patescibacteria group bacterium]|nr:RNA methyltransferase [Patescibacteria group bacterium]